MGTGLSTTLWEVNRDVAMNVRLFQELRGPARVEIARRLSHARPFASAAFPDLVRALNDPDTDVRDAAEVALFDGSGSLPAELYLPLLSDSDPDLRQGCATNSPAFARRSPRFIEFRARPVVRVTRSSPTCGAMRPSGGCRARDLPG